VPRDHPACIHSGLFGRRPPISAESKPDLLSAHEAQETGFALGRNPLLKKLIDRARTAEARFG
jgi:hypothetical protein